VAKTATKSRSGNGRRATSPTTKSLSEFITERFDEFSRSQKDVARYIVDHLDEAAFQTAEELARRANTSSSTVVRFSQALGFEGYPELQQAAIEEYRGRAPEGNGTLYVLLDAERQEIGRAIRGENFQDLWRRSEQGGEPQEGEGEGEKEDEGRSPSEG